MTRPPTLPIAPGKTNTIANTPNVLRLPLGWSETDRSPTGAETWFWLIIPTTTGGKLTITHEGGGQVSLWRDEATKLADGVQGKIEYTIKPPMSGRFFVVAEGGSTRTVSSELVHVGFARDTTSPKEPPIVPWNFYYWPASRKTHEREARAVLDMIRKLARAFGKDPEAAAQWEFLHHQVSDASGWAGHCHNAALASVVFEEPKAQTVRGVPLTEEEVEFLATEWVGNYATMNIVFQLNKGAPPRKYRAEYPAMHFKPGEPKTREQLARAFRSYDPSLPEDVAAKLGRDTFDAEKGFASVVDGYFGELAAEFYETVVKKIGIEGHALVADLRPQDPSYGPAAVWNHAVFYYRATYREAEPRANNPYDLIVKLDLYANADTQPSPGLPALVKTNGEVVVGPGSGAAYRQSVNTLRLVFEPGSGNVMRKYPLNEWRSCTSSDTGMELYAPDFLREVAPIGPSPKKRLPKDDTLLETLSVGNPYIEMEPVSGTPPVLQVRRKYK